MCANYARRPIESYEHSQVNQRFCPLEIERHFLKICRIVVQINYLDVL